MRHVAVLLLSLAGVSFASGRVGTDPSTQKVSVTIRAATADRVVAEVSKKVGVRLEIAPSIKDLVLCIQADDMPVDDLLKNLAELVGGEWVRTGETMTLQRRQGFVAKLKRDQRDEDIAAIRASIARSLAEVDRKPAFDQAEAEALTKMVRDHRAKPVEAGGVPPGTYAVFSSVRMRTPASRAMTRILGSIDPGFLADMAPRAKVVFSTNPTAMQLPLSDRAKADLARFVEEQEIWVQHSGELGDSEDSDRDGGNGWVILEGRRPIKGPVGKVLITVMRVSPETQYSLSLNVYDAKGARVLTTSSLIAARDEAQLPSAPDPAEPKVELSEDSQAVMRSLISAMLGGPGEAVPLPKPVLEKVLQPELYDPLSFGITDLFFSVAKFQKRALFAQIDDDKVNFTIDPEKRMPVSLAIFALERVFTLTSAEGVLFARPRRQAQSEYLTLPRPVLGGFLRTLAKQGKLSLDQLAEFHFRGGAAVEYPNIDRLLATLVTGSMASEYFDPVGLRFIGSLSPGQRATAQQGGIALRTLDPQQRALAHEMVLGPHSEFSFSAPPSPTRQANPSDLSLEPTEAFPNGVPVGTVVTLKLTEDDVLVSGALGSPTFRERTLSAPEIAMELFRTEHPQLFGGGEYETVDMNQLVRATRLTLRLELILGETARSLRTFYDTTKKGRAKLADMPAGFRKKVDDEMARLRSLFLRRGGG